MNLEKYSEFLTARELYELLRVSKSTLLRWNKQGIFVDGVDFIRINPRGDKRYKKEAILKFLNEKKIV